MIGKTDCPSRPRILYSVIFAWLAICGGRFIAPFLEHEADFSDTLIGFAVAMQIGITSILGTVGGSWADVMERKYPNQGRSYVIISGVVGGSVFFLMHGTWRLFPGVPFFQSTLWHMTLRFLYATSVSVVSPVLDGLTLARLEREPNKDKSDYGEERLHGAIWWGVTNLVMGPFIDWLGFPALYMFAALATLASIVVMQIYVRGQMQDASQRTDSNNETKSEDDEHRLPIWSLLQIIFGTVAASAFIFSYFCLSSGFSVVENLVFLYFESLGGSNSLDGLTVALTVIFEIPIFYLAPTLLRKFGPFVLLQIANAAYVTRVIGYTLIPTGSVYFVLLLEPLHGVIYGCSQTGAVEFVSKLMPLGYEASGQGILYLFRGLGGISGVSLGGFLQEQLGARVMYGTFAAIVAAGALVFALASTLRGTSAERRSLLEGVRLEPLTPNSQVRMMQQSGEKEQSDYGSTQL